MKSYVTLAAVAIAAIAVTGYVPKQLGAAAAQTAVPGDAVNGSRLFMQCRACHTVNAGGRNGVGPNLARVMGAPAASKPGYVYSPGLKRAKVRWNPATMDAFLKRPSAVAPGTKMAFGGMSNPKARADMIAYLNTLK